MALIYIEKFAKYANNADIVADNGWGGGNSSNIMVPAFGRFGDPCLRIRQVTGTYEIPWAARTSSTTMIVATATKVSPTAASSLAVIPIMGAMYDPLVSFHWSLVLDPGGNLCMRDAGNNVVGSCPFGFGIWRWIEVKVSMENAGSAIVRIDGVEVMNISGDFRQSTSNTISSFRLHGFTTPDGSHYDELILMDGTGASFNDFIGDLRIEASIVDTDGAVVDWAPSAGSAFQCVDDALAAYNDDTDYVSSSTTDQDAYFSHVDLVAPGLDEIRFVALTALARDDGTNTLRLQVDSGGTVARSATDLDPGTTYRWITEAWALDPNTADAWTPSAVNGAEYGIRCRP
jgi:hypothetical protein